MGGRPRPRPEFLQLLAAADVLLDPITFGGGNTSYEALAMGTPVVTLPGELLRTRITRALYAKAGYEDLVVDSAEGYIDTALRLGTDSDGARSRARAVDATSGVLFEDHQEIRDLEAAFVDMLAGKAGAARADFFPSSAHLERGCRVCGATDPKPSTAGHGTERGK